MTTQKPARTPGHVTFAEINIGDVLTFVSHHTECDGTHFTDTHTARVTKKTAKTVLAEDVKEYVGAADGPRPRRYQIRDADFYDRQVRRVKAVVLYRVHAPGIDRSPVTYDQRDYDLSHLDETEFRSQVSLDNGRTWITTHYPDVTLGVIANHLARAVGGERRARCYTALDHACDTVGVVDRLDITPDEVTALIAHATCPHGHPPTDTCPACDAADRRDRRILRGRTGTDRSIARAALQILRTTDTDEEIR